MLNKILYYYFNVDVIFSVLVMHSVCHVGYFRSWDDGRDKNEIAFFILGTKSCENKI